jgi:membrane-associated HD superfamily phosphohydrolase
MSTQQEIEHHYKVVRDIDYSLLAIMLVANIVVLFMFVKRRDLQPIKVKGWKLIFMSLLGNLCIVIMDIVIKIL